MKTIFKISIITTLVLLASCSTPSFTDANTDSINNSTPVYNVSSIESGGVSFDLSGQRSLVNLGPKNVSLSWNKIFDEENNEAAYYVVHVKSIQDNSDYQTVVVPSNYALFSVQNGHSLKYGTSYYWYVEAKNNNDVSFEQTRFYYFTTIHPTRNASIGSRENNIAVVLGLVPYGIYKMKKVTFPGGSFQEEPIVRETHYKLARFGSFSHHVGSAPLKIFDYYLIEFEYRGQFFSQILSKRNWSSSNTNVITNTGGVVDIATIVDDSGNTFTIRGSHTNLVISDSTKNIDNNVFSDRGLTSVIIPDSVTNIGNYSFQNNQLTSLIIPDSVVTIGQEAFMNNQLTSVSIGNSVVTIGQEAFMNNQLTSVSIGNSVVTIGQEAFMNNQLTNVSIGNSVTNIGNYSFQNNQLTSVSIGNSVVTIGQDAFQNNQLTSVSIGNSVETIGQEAFMNNQLTNVSIGNSVTNIGNYSFQNNQLTSVSIGNSVVTIGQDAFQNNPSLTNVTLSTTLYTNLGMTRTNVFGTQVKNWYKPDGSRQ